MSKSQRTIIIGLLAILWVISISLDASAINIVSSFSPDIPSQYSSPVGLTWDGNYLWTSVMGQPTGRIYKISPSDGSIVSWFDSPGEVPHGLAWDGNYLWSVDSSLNTIFKLNPSDGSILSSFQTPKENPHGLTYNGNYLWLADSYETNTIFKIEPQDGSVIELFEEIYSPGGAWGASMGWRASLE